MKEKEDLRIVKTKASLYRSLLDTMKTKPFEDIKISEICSKALINRSTFYDHFNDKYELLEAMLVDMKGEFIHITESDKKPNSIREYYEELLKKIINHIEHNKEIYSSIVKTNNNSLTKDIIMNRIIEISTKDLEELSNIKTSNQTKTFILFYTSGFVNVIFNELKDINNFNKNELYRSLLLLMPNTNK